MSILSETTETMTVTVYDIIAVERRVEVPTVCPHCCQELTKIQVWEYQDTRRNAVIKGGTIDAWEGNDRGGDCYFHISWSCPNCDYCLVQGDEEHVVASEHGAAQVTVSAFPKGSVSREPAGDLECNHSPDPMSIKYTGQNDVMSCTCRRCRAVGAFQFEAHTAEIMWG